MQNIIGKKVGMTRVFDEHGNQVPVTVLEVGPCPVLKRKTVEKDGYNSVQLGFEPQKESRVTKPRLGQFKKAGVDPHRIIREFRVDASNESAVGDTVTAASFSEIAYVDISAKTKGRGFQSVIKRHNMATGRMSHGGHSKRRPGSIGCSSYPARVIKGKKMPGHMGNNSVTQKNLKIVQINEENNVLLVKGAVPGPNGGIVYISKALSKG
jgi:large subunit ribosomal protein L3